MLRNDRVGHIVEAPRTQLAARVLPLGLRVVAPLGNHLSAVTAWTRYLVRPAEAADGCITLRVVNEGLHGYHGTSRAQGFACTTCLG